MSRDPSIMDCKQGNHMARDFDNLYHFSTLFFFTKNENKMGMHALFLYRVGKSTTVAKIEF